MRIEIDVAPVDAGGVDGNRVTVETTKIGHTRLIALDVHNEEAGETATVTLDYPETLELIRALEAAADSWVRVPRRTE